MLQRDSYQRFDWSDDCVVDITTTVDGACRTTAQKKNIDGDLCRFPVDIYPLLVEDRRTLGGHEIKTVCVEFQAEANITTAFSIALAIHMTSAQW
mmetsp:Transcript_22043/g.32811  ORF Transcript_22043/g.32811 Transcript_22043/m.32811 type:complete len:95 (+) Transcript_22043:229-513(+)